MASTYSLAKLEFEQAKNRYLTCCAMGVAKKREQARGDSSLSSSHHSIDFFTSAINYLNVSFVLL